MASDCEKDEEDNNKGRLKSRIIPSSPIQQSMKSGNVAKSHSKVPNRLLDYLYKTGKINIKTLFQIEDKVCSWVCLSYGLVSPEYHEAIAREIIRQTKLVAKIAVTGSEEVASSWFPWNTPFVM